MSSSPENRDVAPVRALVLSGGGGRGAYEVGVMRACAERNFHFDWIVGTSIGAINACLAGQNDLAELTEIWRRIKNHDVYKFPNPGHLRRVVFGQQLGCLNTSPLESLLRSCVSLERLKKGTSKVGFVTTDLCTLTTRVITSDEIDSQDDLIDALMASSAIPLLFPPRHLGGEGCWIDGGLVRNTPIQAAIRLGATEIYAVLVEPNSIDTCPNSITQLVSRLAEIVFDHSARSGIAHVNQHNRMVDLGDLRTSGNGNYCRLDDKDVQWSPVTNGSQETETRLVCNNCEIDKARADINDHITQSAFDFVNPKKWKELKRVRLFIVTPARQVVGSMLEFDPVISSWLLALGYDDIIRKCIAVA